MRWYHRTPISDVISRDKILRISNIEIKHEGNYLCYGTYRRKQKSFLAAATLLVYGETRNQSKFFSPRYFYHTHKECNMCVIVYCINVCYI